MVVVKCDLIRVDFPRWRKSKGLYDDNLGVVFEYKWGRLRRKTGFNCIVKSAHMLSSKKGKPCFLVDVKGVESFRFKNVPMSGSSVRFDMVAVVKESYDGDKLNDLAYLIEPSFWKRFGGMRWTKWMKFSVLLAGMGVMQLLRMVLQGFGVYLP